MFGFNIKVIAIVALMVVAISANADNVTITGLKIERLAADATGQNKFVFVSPSQPQCYAVGLSVMLFNNSAGDPNTSIIYSTLLAAMMADKSVEIIHDGSTYCKIVRVTVSK